MTIEPRSFVHALAIFVFLNRKPPFVGDERLFWFNAIDDGLVVC